MAQSSSLPCGQSPGHVLRPSMSKYSESSWRNLGSVKANSRKHLKNVNFFGQSWDSGKLLQYVNELNRSEMSIAAFDLLAGTLRPHPMFQSLPKVEFDLILKAMRRVELAAGTNLVQQGDTGETCYVVEQGELYMHNEAARISTLIPGSIFGDMGLIDECMYTGSVTAHTESVVWSLTGEVYRKTLAACSLKQLEETKKALSNVELFSGLSPHQLSMLAQSVKTKAFPAEHRIITKGETGSEMYVVRDGMVRITFHDEPDGLVSREDITANGQLNDDHEVALTAIDLGAGAYFGERALLYREPRAAHVTARIETSCFVVSQTMFNALLGPLADVLEINVRMDMLRSLKVFENMEAVPQMRLAESMRVLKFQGGENIITAGQPAQEFCIIKSGKVGYQRQVRTDDGDLTNAMLVRHGSESKMLSAGDTFGTEALSGDLNYSTTAVALTAVEIFIVSRAVIQSLGLTVKTSIRARSASIAMRRPSDPSNASFNELDLASPYTDMYSDLDDLELIVQSPDDLEVMRTLGCGSFGRVKLARHQSSDTVIALKILQKHEVVVMKQQKNIVKEKEMLQQLKHPFILRLYGTFQDANCLYMMLELVRGGELFRLLHGDGSEENALQTYDVRFYCATLLSIYQHIHSKKIVYRDLKPENILIDEFGYLKLVDWGFAKEVIDKTYTLCGTPEYLSPEAVQGIGHNMAADYWALGALTFEMLTGYSPFVGNDANDTMAICQNVVHGVIEFPDSIDHEVKDLIQSLCTKDPIHRLGCLKGGTKDVMDQVWFANIDWDALNLRELIAPWVPEIKDSLDVSHFDDIYDQDPEYIAEFDGDNEDFEGF